MDKRYVSEFRHINTRIANTNLAFPCVRDTFTIIGSSKCEVVSVIDLKDAFYSLRHTEESKKYFRTLPHFSSTSYLFQRIQIGLKIPPAI